MTKQFQIVQAALVENKELFQKKYKIKQFGVFGSCVRDDFTAESDIDLLVEFDEPIGIEFVDLADELETLLSRKVDLVSKNGIAPRYFSQIESELIYV
jgi:predicted nucleotidyltransferase